MTNWPAYLITILVVAMAAFALTSLTVQAETNWKAIKNASVEDLRLCQDLAINKWRLKRWSDERNVQLEWFVGKDCEKYGLEFN